MTQNIDRNEIVYSIQYSPKDGTVLPIKVYTYEDREKAERIANNRKLFFIPVYGLELAAVVWFYFKKRMK